MIELNITATKDLVSKNTIKLVQSLTPIKSELYLTVDNRNINMKSILGVLSANIKAGDTFVVKILNDDTEVEVKKIITNFFEKD